MRAALGLGFWLCATATLAAEPAAAPPYTPKGADTCLKCHDEDKAVPVVAIFKTAHGRPSNPRAPLGQLQCETCHGPGGDHARKVREGEVQPRVRDFGARAVTPVAQQNEVCLGCHRGGARTAWPGSEHERADVPCAACHTVHAEHDRVATAGLQAEACFGCHTRERAESHLPFGHPLRQGKLACSECHAVHGSMGPSLLAKPSVNETCFTCHAEKRGPFLWEHAPVAEDCTLCHKPHNSTQPALLVQRPPLLCQQCHSQAGHPSVPYTPSGLPSGSPNGFLLVQSCANCHSQVHGSNHPSGATLTR